MKKIFAFISFILFLIALWVFRTSTMDLLAWFGDREAVTQSIEKLGIWGPFVLIVLLILQVFLAFIPGQALMIACGYVYGFWAGLLISWFGLFAGGQAAFALARRFGRPFAERWITAEVLSKWDKAADGQGVGFYALSLVLPIFPNDAMCYVAGLGKISFRRFTLANTLGRGLACLFTSAAGAFGGQLGWQGWGLIALVIVIICLGWMIFRHLRSSFRIV